MTPPDLNEVVEIRVKIYGTRAHAAAWLREMAARTETDAGFRSSSTGGPEGAAWSVEPKVPAVRETT